MVCCLTGFTVASGKSTVGRLLASQLAWHFSDLDSGNRTVILALPISQIF